MNPNDLAAALTAPPLEAADLLSPLLQGPAIGLSLIHI